MKRSSLILRMSVGALIASAGFASTNYLMGQTAVPTTAPSTAPRVLASINGEDVDASKFEDILMAVAGMRLLDQVIDLLVVQQACRQAGVAVDSPEFQKNVQAELDRALANLGAQGVKPEFQMQALSQILQRQGVTNPEFEMGLRRAACLRSLSKGKIVPTDTDIKNLFDLEYGERVRGRLFVAPTYEAAGEVVKMINEQKIDLNEIAQQKGLQLQQVVIAATNDNKDIATLKKIAFTMPEKTSSAAIPQEKGGWLVFFLDKKEASQNIKIESVKEKLRERIIEQGEVEWGKQHLARLRQMANIRINEPILSKQLVALNERMKAATTQPTSAPATAPARP